MCKQEGLFILYEVGLAGLACTLNICLYARSMCNAFLDVLGALHTCSGMLLFCLQILKTALGGCLEETPFQLQRGLWDWTVSN